MEYEYTRYVHICMYAFAMEQGSNVANIVENLS